MTDALTDRSRQNNQLLAKLAELDIGALTQVVEDPELVNELMADRVSSGRIAETAILALDVNPVFAKQFREVFKLDYVTLMSINPHIGIELEKVAWHMFENDLEGILGLLRDWKVPSGTMKIFALEYFFQRKEGPNPAICARVMAATKLSGDEIQSYCEEEFRRAVRDGQMKSTNDKVTAALIAKVNGGAEAQRGEQDITRGVVPTADA